jgi:uncharacterized protein
MHCSNCGVCCTETEMLLSKEDIERLKNEGYQKSEFVYFDKKGYATLKNHRGYCVFYDRKNRKCGEYTSRPAGCRVYPVIVDEEKGIIVDDICECGNTISEHEKEVKGRRVIGLLELIDIEALERRKKRL